MDDIDSFSNTKNSTITFYDRDGGKWGPDMYSDSKE